MIDYEAIWRRYGRDADGTQFIAALRARMVRLRVRPAALARESGCDPRHVSRWLNGRVAPSLENKLLLDEALDRLEEGK